MTIGAEETFEEANSVACRPLRDKGEERRSAFNHVAGATAAGMKPGFAGCESGEAGPVTIIIFQLT